MIVSTKGRWAVSICGAMLALSASAQQQEEPAPAPPPEEPPAEQAAPAAEEPPPAKPKLAIGDPPLHRWGGLTVAGEAWGPDLINQDFEVAIVNAGRNTRILELSTNGGTRQHWRVWYHLPKDMGSIRFEYDSMHDQGETRILEPGNFIYGELLVTATFAGLEDDGLADGVIASGEAKTREFRIEYERVAFDTPRTKGSFHFGYHSVDHARNLRASYYALLPTFPPFLPPNFPPDYDPTFLLPLPDQGTTSSDFSGGGIGGGFDVEFKLHPRVSLWGGFSAGVLRGTIDSRYSSTVSAYFLAGGGGATLLTFDEVLAIIASDTPTTNPTDLIFQSSFESFFGVERRSRLAYEIDLSLSVELKIWRSLTAYVGLRDLAYIDVATDVRPGAPVLQPTGTFNSQQVIETDRSVGYEGYFLGLSYRF